MTGSQQLRDFQPTTTEGDPGKLAYLHNADWTPKPFEELGAVKAMPGTCLLCVFGHGTFHSAACPLHTHQWTATINPTSCILCGAPREPYKMHSNWGLR